MNSSNPENPSAQEPFYISYSQWRTFKDCPAKFGFAYSSPEGNTNPKPVATTSKRVPINSSFGSSIGYIAEWFYKDFWWGKKNPLKTCIDSIPDAIRWFIMKYERNHGAIDVNMKAQVWEETTELLNQHVPDMLNIIRSQELLSENSNAEVDLTTFVKHSKYDFSVKMVGRADFVHYKSDSEVWIIDGKGTLNRDAKIDPNQLIWYASQHYIKFGVIPSRIGFVFWAFPEDPMSWVAFDSNDMKLLVDSVFKTACEMKVTKYEPKESVNCLSCDYSGSCPSGSEYISIIRKARGINEQKTFIIGDI